MLNILAPIALVLILSAAAIYAMYKLASFVRREVVRPTVHHLETLQGERQQRYDAMSSARKAVSDRRALKLGFFLRTLGWVAADTAAFFASPIAGGVVTCISLRRLNESWKECTYGVQRANDRYNQTIRS